MPLPALEVSNLVMSYGDRTVVDDVSFTVNPGTIAVILGPNGAGKTTAVESCEGLRTPNSGTVTLLGYDRVRDDAEIRNRVGVMLQDGGLPQAVKAGDVLAHIARLHKNPRNVSELLDTLDLTEHAGTRVRHLSGGQRQRLSLACAIVGNPELVFLDEPSAGMDPASRRTMHALVRSLANSGTTVVLTTHLMDEAEILADQVIVMRNGRIVADGRSTGLLCGRSIWIESDETDSRGIESIERLLSSQLTGFQYRRKDDRLEVFTEGSATTADLTKVATLLERERILDVSVALRSRSLEDLYFDLVETK